MPHLGVSDRNGWSECFTDNRCNHPVNNQSIVQTPASSTPSTGVSDGDTCNWFHSVKQRNRGMVREKMRQLYRTVMHCAADSRQTHIYSERRSEAEGAAEALQRCFIEFVRLFPSLRPNPFLYLFYPSHTHTNSK